MDVYRSNYLTYLFSLSPPGLLDSLAEHWQDTHGSFRKKQQRTTSLIPLRSMHNPDLDLKCSRIRDLCVILSQEIGRLFSWRVTNFSVSDSSCMYRGVVSLSCSNTISNTKAVVVKLKFCVNSLAFRVNVPVKFHHTQNGFSMAKFRTTSLIKFRFTVYNIHNTEVSSHQVDCILFFSERLFVLLFESSHYVSYRIITTMDTLQRIVLFFFWVEKFQ